MTDSRNLPPRGGETYSSATFMTMARTPEGFQSALPQFVRSLLDNTPLTTSDPQAIGAYDAMLSQTVILYNTGSTRLLAHVYGDFAQNNNLLHTVKIFDNDIETPIPVEQLSEHQRLDWEAYQYIAEIPRTMAVTALSRVLHMNLPSVRYIKDPNVHEIHERLRNVPYHVIESVLPDLTDDEARSFFGQLTTAANVHEQAAKYSL